MSDSGASSYYLYVLDTTTNKPVINDTSVTGTSFTPTTPLTAGHSYTWYIGAKAPLASTGPLPGALPLVSRLAREI